MKYRTPSYAEGVYDCYFFEKNLQGDIIAVYNSSGTKLITYDYDAWGKCTTTYVVAYYSCGGAVNNPFRYRGYYYDTETGWYYLQSRYYNPEWGRFLNADGYLNANGDIIGYNMFAYCSNNPVMYVDPSGQNIVEWFKQKKQAMADGVKALTIKAVMFYLNPNEQAVLEAEWFAFYKGAPVLKVPFMGDNAFSCGTIFMGKDEGLKPVDVRHEYGHYLQLKEIGMPKYLKFVAIPSLVDYWGGTSREDYYSQPQEYIADIYGKANRTDYKYKEDAGVRANAYWDYVKKPFVFDIYDYIPIHTSSDLFAYFPQ